MTLQPGCPLVVAPSFHLPVDWADRLRVGAGVEREGNGFFPRPSWRGPDDRERGLLVPDASLPFARGRLPDCLCLFQLPRHLQAAWWHLLEQAPATGTGCLDGFDAFAIEVASFLAFKEIPVPDGAAFDLLVRKPGRRSVPWNGALPGLTFNRSGATPIPMPEEARGPALWGGINLGDEPTALVFLNLPVPDLLDELRRCHPELSPPGTLGELTERFLTLCPDYPPVRLRLEPGEGFRLPAGGLLADGCNLDKREADVWLLIREPGSGPLPHPIPGES